MILNFQKAIIPFSIAFMAVMIFAGAFVAGDVFAESRAKINLGIENPGMLPGHPFYFLKEWGRGVRGFFTFSAVEKADFDLEVLNQRAAEIKALEEKDPQKTEALATASENYQRNAERLEERLERLEETSQNPNVAELVEKLVERTVVHHQLFEGLKDDAAQKAIARAAAVIPEKLENAEAFAFRLGAVLEARKEAIEESDAVKITGLVEEELKKRSASRITEFEAKIAEAAPDEAEALRQKVAAEEVSAASREEALKIAIRPADKKLPQILADHFKCYRVTGSVGGEEHGGFNIIMPQGLEEVTLKDQFGPVAASITEQPIWFCNPVEKRHVTRDIASKTPILDKNAHLAIYSMSFAVNKPSVRQVFVTNQFGRQVLTLREPKYLAVPTQKIEVAGKPTGLVSPQNLDHFNCYAAIGRMLGVTLDLRDQFHTEKEARVLLPEFFCNPAEKTHGDVITPIKNSYVHLTCYSLAYSAYSTRVLAENQFGRERLNLSNPELLCAPSKKEMPLPPPKTPLPPAPQPVIIPLPQPAVSPAPAGVAGASCADLEKSKKEFFNLCAKEGYDDVCFNKFTEEYQGCGRNTRNECTLYNVNRDQNVLCKAKLYPGQLPPPPLPATAMNCALIEEEIKKLLEATPLDSGALAKLSELQKDLVICRGGIIPAAEPEEKTDMSCASFKESQQFYFNLCAKEGYDNVCLNKLTGGYQGCTRNSYNDCTEHNLNREKNILCGL